MAIWLSSVFDKRDFIVMKKTTYSF